MSLRILVAGGGIGGITTALCLARQGYEVAVFEQASALEETGAGIQLSPNCTRVLHELGLEEAIRASAFLPQGAEFRHWRSGRTIAASALGDETVRRYGFPYYHIRRADLLAVLAGAADAVANITLHCDARVTSFDQDNLGVRVSITGSVHGGDVLVGADGIRSVVRGGLWGEEKPRFTGNVAWRALVPADRLPRGMIRPMATVWWGPHKHFVHYYVRRGELVNCVCVVEKEGWELESWTERGDRDELKADFAGWHDDIQRLIDKADEDSLFKWALHDREPMANWGKGRVTLLGDACHPTLPFMAQGAAMAIEDAAVLGACLGDADVPRSLKRYEDLRRRRTARIQRASRRNAAVFHLSGFRAWLRDRVARNMPARTMHGLYSHDATATVRSRPDRTEYP